MRRFFSRALLAGAALASFSCAALGASGAGKGEVAIDESAAGAPVSLRRGEQLTVSLRGNPTTGYLWRVAQGTEAILAQQGEPRFAPDSRLLGAGGTFVFTFRAVSPGSATLRLDYARPFEPDKAPERSFEAPVTVTE